MKIAVLAFSVLLMSLTVSCQKATEPKNDNLDFEIVDKGLPVNWTTFGSSDYVFSVDSTVVQNGKYAAALEFHGDNEKDYKALSYSIPATYEGKTVKLSGYIKSENVTGGAGLWMRIDPGALAFDNMQDRSVKGTTGWKKYEITLDLHASAAKNIVVGALLTGKGKIWIDDLQVTIDGKSLADAPRRVLQPAELDKEFDKGSKIDTISPDEQKINNLEILGLVWGFLKYYHPHIAKGDYNWDYELFRILPTVLTAKNSTERDYALSQWILRLGSFETGWSVKTQTMEENKETETQNQVVIKPDLDWIEHSNLSETLADELERVAYAKRSGENYYIDLAPNIGNPVFDHEDAYGEMKYPDAGFRLLSLFSYWNKIQYFFPYKDLIKEDWKAVLKEFIPKFVNAANSQDYELAALELIGRIHDTHANIYSNMDGLNKYFGVYYSPVEVTFIENKPVVTGYYNDISGKASGMKIGDEIISINAQPVAAIIKEQLKYTPASNYSTQLRNMSKNLLRSNDSTINVQYKRNGETKTAVLKTYSSQSMDLYKNYTKTDTCFKIINKNIGYIYPGTIHQSYFPAIEGELKNTKGLIIDMRCYPREFIVFSFGQYLMPASAPFVKFTTGSISNPGLFKMGEPLSVGKKNDDYCKGKVVIIVNELTQSQAEYTTMAFRTAPNVTVIGSTTAGADGNVSTIYLVGGIRTMISGIGVFYPDGKGTQRVGIVPDVVVNPTIEGIKNGKDEVLEKAIEIVGGR